MFKLYFNPHEQRYINATEFAYESIYRAQGFLPAGSDENVIRIPPQTPTETDIQGRGGTENNGTGNRTGKRRK